MFGVRDKGITRNQRESGGEGRSEGGRSRHPIPYTQQGILARKSNSGTLGNIPAQLKEEKKKNTIPF